jgi:hypothetical protein
MKKILLSALAILPLAALAIYFKPIYPEVKPLK